MTDIAISQALKIVDQTLNPEQLNTVEELILRECWANKTYMEIAIDSGYDADYIRVVGSRIWRNLSNALKEKVTKNNFKSVLNHQIQSGQFLWNNLELPDGKVPLKSDFYIERKPFDNLTIEQITRPGALIRINSPLNMGKTSLMTRILDQARSRNYKTITINFQLAEASLLWDLHKFLRWLMINITFQLEIKSELPHYWDEDLGSKISCTNYLQKYILQQFPEPLVLAFDEVDRLFEYPAIAQEFLPLLRFWHEEGNDSSIWQRVRIVEVHSTNSYLPLNINYSPFNFGLPVNLTQFDFEQMKQLANRHQLDQKNDDLDHQVKSLMKMIGGYPYLARLAFYALSTTNLTFERLLEEAPTATGIYRDHLQGHLSTLEKYPELATAYKKVVNAEEPIQIPAIAAYKLESIGLVKMSNNNVAPSCKLYRLYFREFMK